MQTNVFYFKSLKCDQDFPYLRGLLMLAFKFSACVYREAHVLPFDFRKSTYKHSKQHIVKVNNSIERASFIDFAGKLKKILPEKALPRKVNSLMVHFTCVKLLLPPVDMCKEHEQTTRFRLLCSRCRHKVGSHRKFRRQHFSD